MKLFIHGIVALVLWKSLGAITVLRSEIEPNSEYYSQNARIDFLLTIQSQIHVTCILQA